VLNAIHLIVVGTHPLLVRAVLQNMGSFGIDEQKQ